MLDHIKDLVGFAFEHGLWVCRVWYTRVYQNMTSNGGLTPRRLYGCLWPVEVARWLGSTLGDMNHKPMASISMVCTFYMPCITSQNVQFGTPGCTGSCRLDTGAQMFDRWYISLQHGGGDGAKSGDQRPSQGGGGGLGGAGLMPKRAELAIESKKRSIKTQNKRTAGETNTGETDKCFPWIQEYLVRCKKNGISESAST